MRGGYEDCMKIVLIKTGYFNGFVCFDVRLYYDIIQPLSVVFKYIYSILCIFLMLNNPSSKFHTYTNILSINPFSFIFDQCYTQIH